MGFFDFLRSKKDAKGRKSDDGSAGSAALIGGAGAANDSTKVPDTPDNSGSWLDSLSAGDGGGDGGGGDGGGS